MIKFFLPKPFLWMIATKSTRKKKHWSGTTFALLAFYFFFKKISGSLQSFPPKYFQPYFYVLVGMYQAALADP
jgi:hypothetical protein